MHTPHCILCGGSDTRLVDSIPSQALSSLYRQRAGVDAARLFSREPVGLYECRSCGLKFYYPQVIGDGPFYDELQRYPGYYMEDKEEFHEAARWIGADENVLEVGCGAGAFRGFIRCGGYTGLEFSDEAIAQARGRGLSVVKEDLGAHAANHAEQYDVVCYFQVLEHVPAPGAFVRDSLRCLRPGGKLILAVPSEDSFIRHAANFYLNMPPHHASRWTDATLRKVGELNGLELLHLHHEKLNDHHRKFYAKTKAYSAVNRLLRRNPGSVDLSLGSKLLYGFAAVVSAPKAARIKADSVMGQSVLAVYRK